MQRLLPYPAASFTGIQVGAALVASEAVVETTGAAGLSFWRYLIASIVLVPFWVASQKPSIGRSDFWPISIIGTGQFGPLIAMLNVAFLLASPERVSFIFATLPLITLAFEWARFHMRIGKTETLAVLLSVLGIAELLETDPFRISDGFVRISGPFSDSDGDTDRGCLARGFCP